MQLGAKELISAELAKLTTTSPKKRKTIVVYHQGKPIITKSKKRAWSQIGHAKLALLNHFSDIEHDYVYEVTAVDYFTRSQQVAENLRTKTSKDRDARRAEFRNALYNSVQFIEI